MKLKYSLLPVLMGLALWGCTASPTVSSQEKAKGDSKMTEATPTPQPSPRGYSKDLEAMRASFNRDKGKVRLVTLLSPT